MVAQILHKNEVVGPTPTPGTMDHSLLTVSNLSVRFGEKIVIDDLSFEVGKDQTLAVIGPNGAGKTVLFRALLGLTPHRGEVKWKKGIRVGYVPQRLSVESDLPITTAEFFELKGISKDEARHTLKMVGFKEDSPHPGHLEEHVLSRKLGVLSGGELQRVLIAWALVGAPEVLLFDEPTAGVDASAEETIYSLLHRLHDEEKLTIILISHDLQVVYRYATTVLCLNKEKVCYGPPQSVLHQESLEKLYGKDVGFYHHHDHHK